MSSLGYYHIIENDILFNKEISITTVRLYAIIRLYANCNKNGCFLTYSNLAEMLNCSKRQILRMIDFLVKNNYVNKKIKNQRVYLVPTVLVFLKKREELNNQKQKIFDYDWLTP